jgi:ligand-binding SRPBCC domain-containing protein
MKNGISNGSTSGGKGRGALTWALSTPVRAPDHSMTLHRDTIVPASLEETFAFFADAANLQRLTPEWLNFTVLTPMPVVMRRGLEIEYRIRLYGVPVPWKSSIDLWEPGVRFVDRQIVGPYRWWRHEHRFEAVAGGTKVTDHVDYLPRAAWLLSRFVQRDLERIFTYRQHALREIFRP